MCDEAERPQRQKRFVFDNQIPRVGKEIFTPVFPDIFLKRLRIGVAIGIVFPHDDEFHFIAVSGVHEAVAQRRIHPGTLNGKVNERIRAIPAEMLERDSVLCHEFDLPVGHFRISLIIRTNKRRIGVKIGNSVPAEMVSFTPHVAHIDADFVSVMTHIFRLGAIIGIIVAFLADDIAE